MVLSATVVADILKFYEVCEGRQFSPQFSSFVLYPVKWHERCNNTHTLPHLLRQILAVKRSHCRRISVIESHRHRISPSNITFTATHRHRISPSQDLAVKRSHHHRISPSNDLTVTGCHRHTISPTKHIIQNVSLVNLVSYRLS